MAVTMAEISKLRKLTGAGMMDCKNALTETNGDIEAAKEIIGSQNVKEQEAPKLGVESFAYFALERDSAFYFFGCCQRRFRCYRSFEVRNGFRC